MNTEKESSISAIGQPIPLPLRLLPPGVQMLAICLFGLIAYCNSLHAELVFDDFRVLVHGSNIKFLENFFTTASFLDIRYVCDLSFAINYALHGLDPVGYHVVNLAIHLITALFVYTTVRLLFQTSRLATDNRASGFSSYIPFCVSLVFVTHPIQTQAVTYVVQRYASLATLFYIASITLYLMFRLGTEADIPKQKQTGYLLFSLFAALLAVKTKEITFTLPFMLLLIELLFFMGKNVSRLRVLIPYAAIAMLIPLSTVMTKASSGDLVSTLVRATSETTEITRYHYLLTQFNVIITYIRLLLFPTGQHIDYERVIYTSFDQPAVLLPLLALAALLSVAVVICRYGIRQNNSLYILAAFGIFWFFLSLTVESSIIPISDALFEHRVYLPSIGFILSVCCIVAACIPVAVCNGTIPIALPIITTLSIILGTATYVRNSVWQNRISIWKENVEKEPRNELGHLNLAYSYQAKGMIKEAEKEFEATIRINGEKRPLAIYRLGLLQKDQKRYEAALKNFLLLLTIFPKEPKAYIEAGTIYLEQGQLMLAEQYFGKALDIEPKNSDAYYSRGVVRQQKGKLQGAAADYSHALKYKPDHSKAANKMGMMLLDSGNVPEAIGYFNKAIVSAPYNFEAINNLIAAKKLLTTTKR